MASKPKPIPTPSPEDFSEDEMGQIQHYGQALQHGGTTDFDEAVESHLADHYPHEAGHRKMKAAQTGGSLGDLGPTQMEQTAAKQQGTLQQQAGTQGQAQAAQAQAAQVAPAPPPAPGSSVVGVSQPYPAERQETPPGVPDEPPEAPGSAK